MKRMREPWDRTHWRDASSEWGSVRKPCERLHQGSRGAPGQWNERMKGKQVNKNKHPRLKRPSEDWKLAECPRFVEPKQLKQIWVLVKSRVPEFVEPKHLKQTRVLVKRARLTAKRSTARPNARITACSSTMLAIPICILTTARHYNPLHYKTMQCHDCHEGQKHSGAQTARTAYNSTIQAISHSFMSIPIVTRRHTTGSKGKPVAWGAQCARMAWAQECMATHLTCPSHSHVKPPKLTQRQ